MNAGDRPGWTSSKTTGIIGRVATVAHKAGTEIAPRVTVVPMTEARAKAAATATALRKVAATVIAARKVAVTVIVPHKVAVMVIVPRKVGVTGIAPRMTAVRGVVDPVIARPMTVTGADGPAVIAPVATGLPTETARSVQPTPKDPSAQPGPSRLRPPPTRDIHSMNLRQ